MTAGNRYYGGPPSDHFDGTRFFNPGQLTTDRTFGDLLRWRFSGGRTRWSEPAPGGDQPSLPTASTASP